MNIRKREAKRLYGSALVFTRYEKRRDRRMPMSGLLGVWFFAGVACAL
jgi:hypothetical protein